MDLASSLVVFWLTGGCGTRAPPINHNKTLRRPSGAVLVLGWWGTTLAPGQGAVVWLVGAGFGVLCFVLFGPTVCTDLSGFRGVWSMERVRGVRAVVSVVSMTLWCPVGRGIYGKSRRGLFSWVSHGRNFGALGSCILVGG